MRIAHLVSTFPPYFGGMGNAVAGMADTLRRRGHDIRVLTPRYRSTHEQVVSHAETQYLRPFGSWGNAAFLPQLFWKLDEYDIVHLHLPFFGGGEAAALWRFSQRRGARTQSLVVTYHMDANAEGLRGRYFSWHNRRVLPWLLQIADRVIATSHDYAEHSLLKSYSSSITGRFHTVPLGVDHERFSLPASADDLRRKYGLTAEDEVLLFVGALDPAHRFKGVEVLLRAFAFYQETRQKEQGKGRAVLLLVGDGRDRPSYAALARELGIDQSVVFVGRVPHDELPSYYAASDLVVLPSTSSSEAFGMVLLEAMASGRPVIASYLPGVRTVVEDGITGFLTKPEDVIGLGKMLHKAFRDSERLKAMGEEGRKRVLERYTWDKVGEALDEIYRGLV